MLYCKFHNENIYLVIFLIYDYLKEILFFWTIRPINIGMQQHLDPFITTVSSQHNPFHNTVSANKSQANFQFQEGYNQLEVANRNSYPNYQVPVVHNNYSAQHAAQQPVEYHHAPVSNDGHYTQQNYQKQGSNTNEQYGYSTFYQQQR